MRNSFLLGFIFVFAYLSIPLTGSAVKYSQFFSKKFASII